MSSIIRKQLKLIKDENMEMCKHTFLDKDTVDTYNMWFKFIPVITIRD